MRRLLLVGGGHAHLGVLKMLATQLIAGWAVTLVSTSSRQIYSGMLPGWIAGRYTIDECSISLTDLAARANTTFHATTITHLSLEDGEVTTADGRAFGFDLLSIDSGSEPAIGGIAGATAHALSIRPIEAFVAAWPAVVEGWKHRHSVIELAIVGSGAAAPVARRHVSNGSETPCASESLPDAIPVTSLPPRQAMPRRRSERTTRLTTDGAKPSSGRESCPIRVTCTCARPSTTADRKSVG